MSDATHPRPGGLTLVWLALMGLTLLSYGLAEGDIALSTPLVLGLGTLKAMLIGAIFMELRTLKGLLAVYWLFFAGLGLALARLLGW